MLRTGRIRCFLATLLVITLLLTASACSLSQIFTPQPSTNASGLTVPGWTFPAADSTTTPASGFVEAVAKIKPAVVIMTVETTYYNWWGEKYSKQSAGSGFIIDPRGYIVTNNHVVEDASSITVKLYDGRTLPASIVGTDPETDLAVIKVDAKNLPYAELGRSSELRQGESVLALGNALGMGEITAVGGIVSALDITITISSRGNTLHNLILIDAPINPGNSGGPLVNMAGEVVGVTCAKIVEVSVEGMGYAISIDSAKPIIEKLIRGEPVLHPRLGVGVRSGGALIVEVSPDGPAAAAGLEPGDMIVKFEGQEIDSAEALWQAIQNCQPGEEVEITYIRDGNLTTTSTVLG